MKARAIDLRAVVVTLAFALLGAALVPSVASASGSAGQEWRYEAGNYGINKIRPHFGPAGPKVGNVEHVNYHVFRIKPYKDFLNVHHSQRVVGGQTCYYTWDSIHNWTLFDSCFPWWGKWAAAAAVAAAVIGAAVGLGWVPVVALPAAAFAL